MTDPDPFKNLRRGLLELAVLTALAPGQLYAAEILERLASTPFATQEGTLYPMLGKLRRDGLLEHEWQESDSGPPRKYHQLTEAGRERRDQLAEHWQQLSTTLEELGASR
jgi:PadR family transcriptional regulator PadR